jgi:phospholipid/cholesterol/gamma-HCH transport system substrate-binding protein
VNNPLRIPSHGGRRALIALVALLLAVLAVRFIDGQGSRTYTLLFTEANGLYAGNDVDILGVRVGEVTEVTPSREHVAVTIRIDDDHPLPDDVKAVIVAPSLVPVRHVALAPAYVDGPRLDAGSTVPLSRTAVPVEWDEVKDQLVRLTSALGPNGANRDGSLSSLLQSSAANLDGQGGTLGRTIDHLAEAMSTVSDSRGDVFATVRNLQVLVEALRASDAQVYEFSDRLASVSAMLAGDRHDLAAALQGMESAFRVLRGFIRENRKDLDKTLRGLGRVAELVARNRQGLADVLQVAPTTISNLYAIGDPGVPAPTGSIVVGQMDSPAQFICSAIFSLGGTNEQCQAALSPIAKYLRLGQVPLSLGLTEKGAPTEGTHPGPALQGDLVTSLETLLKGGVL